MPTIFNIAKSVVLLFAVLLLAVDFSGQFSVNVLTDTPDANPGDGVCSDAGGNCSLRAAIMESNATAGDNTISLPVGEYVLSIAGMNEDASASGDLDILDNLEITGADTRQTIIRADSLDRAFDIFPGVNVSISFLEIWEGSVLAGSGGAIRNQGTLDLSEVGIRASMCEGDGGGLQGGGFGGAIYNSGILTISEVTINSCLALGGKGGNGVAPGGGSGGGAGPGLGGAIYNDQGASCVLINSTISDNSAQGGRGGNGTFHQGSGTVASAGGAGGGFGGASGPANGGGSAGNWGGGGGGGGSLSGAGAAGGFGGGGGGGGANSWGGAAGAAGAAGLFGGAGGQGCCSAGSGGGGAAGLGGGIFNRDGQVEITNCTFAFNQAIAGAGGSGWFSGPGSPGLGKAGAVFNLDGDCFLNNSLFAQNTATTDAPSLFGTFESDAGHNLVELSDAGMNLIGNTANNLIDVDPLILPLANNGGNTDTHLLESCSPISPAIDAGNDAFASAFDQISQARVNVSEIGAVEVLALSVTLLPADTTLCFGETLLLDVTSDNSTYEWNDASTDPTLLIDSEGTYSVTITQNDCDYTDEIMVDFNPLESVDLGPDQNICPDGLIQLDATYPGATYEWQDGLTTATYDALDAGVYSVVVTLDDCSASGSVEIFPVDVVNLDLGPDQSICEGESVDLSTDVVADSYEWNTAEVTPFITVFDAGMYTLDIVVDGCSYSTSVVVDVSDNPTPNLGSDLELCDGETAVLDVSSEAGTYEWQDGSSDATFTVNQSGNYSVTVTLGTCIGSDELEVIYHPIPVFNLGPDVTVCYSSGFQLEVVTEVADVNILWNTGQSSAIITPPSSGFYQATVGANGCSYSDEVNVEIIEELFFDLGPDKIACKGSTVLLNTDAQDFPFPLSYTWSEGESESVIHVTETGTYEVTVESQCDVITDEIRVVFDQCGCEIYVPNAFTPDEDGVNEYFMSESACEFNYFLIQVYNRNGEVIFQSDDPTHAWDGSSRNGDYYVPNGVYAWRLEYISTTLEGVVSDVLQGHVTIIR